MTTPFSGADLVARALAQMGVRHVFGIVSIHNMPLFDAINRLGETKIVDVRHEQAGTHAADGYARGTGRMGVVIASTGPGTSNCVTGLYEAEYASSRVLLITGQAETAFYGRGMGYVHEAEGQVAMLRSVCRRVESPRHVSRLAADLQAVVADIHAGRGAPGAIEIPIDLQYAEAELVDFAVPRTPEQAPDPHSLDRVVAALDGASRRIIVAGGGVIAAGGSEALCRLAEHLDAPVLTSPGGRGAIPEDHPLCVGNFYTSAGIHQAITEADVTLAVGTRFAVGVDGQGARFRPPGKLIQVDIDGAMIGRTHPADLGLAADARLALEAIQAVLLDTDGNDAQFNATVLEARDGVREAMRRRLGDDYPQIMDAMRERLPRDGLFVRDQTIAAYNFGNQLFPVYDPRTTMSPVSGAIGPGFPLAVGAALGTGRQTLLIHGDGGFMFHATELATCAQYQLPLLIVVFNDGGYGVLRWLQDTRFGRINETDLGAVNFATMAESMGVPGCRVDSVAAFADALDVGMAAPGPYLIDVDMERLAPMEISIMPKRHAS